MGRDFYLNKEVVDESGGENGVLLGSIHGDKDHSTTHSEGVKEKGSTIPPKLWESDKNYQLVAGKGGEVRAQKIHSISSDMMLSLAMNHTHLMSLSYLMHPPHPE